MYLRFSTTRATVRTLGALGLLLAAGALLGSCAGTGANDVGFRAAEEQPRVGDPVAVQTPVDAEASGLLFVMRADVGAAEPAEGDSEQLNVTLSDVDPRVLWYHDRPEPSAGEMRLSGFVGQWHDLGFDADPPEAVLRHAGEGGAGADVVVVIRDPVWDQPTSTLRFTAVLAEGSSETLPWLMSDVSVFLDPGPTSAARWSAHQQN